MPWPSVLKCEIFSHNHHNLGNNRKDFFLLNRLSRDYRKLMSARKSELSYSTSATSGDRFPSKTKPFYRFKRFWNFWPFHFFSVTRFLVISLLCLVTPVGDLIFWPQTMAVCRHRAKKSDRRCSNSIRTTRSFLRTDWNHTVNLRLCFAPAVIHTSLRHG